MIRLITNLADQYGDLCEVIRLFYGPVEISPDAGEVTIRHHHAEEGGLWIETADCEGLRQTLTAEVVPGDLAGKRFTKRAAKTCLFRLLQGRTGRTPPWGSLTGIRPTRLVYDLLGEGMSLSQAQAEMERAFFVSPDKAGLLTEILAMQSGIIDSPDDQFDLYIGIPFCTTKCSYCSFASGEIGSGALVEPYLRALEREIDGAAALMAEKGLTVRSAYMGGGTPTSLSAGQLARLLERAIDRFPGAIEWTVEAGRPDTITREKLRAIKRCGVGRISVNPQTFSDETLRRIGRAHSADETVAAYRLAREEGFDHINMDLIAALPGEGLADFERSLRKTIALAPESITVHTLALKRSSRLHEQRYEQAGTGAAEQMVDLARSALRENDFHPYYLYRQKYMAGNLENVGYARPGHACVYNIDNMEETTRILALGAGAISKWLFPRARHIDRAPNVKNIEQYIARVDEMLARKRALIES